MYNLDFNELRYIVNKNYKLDVKYIKKIGKPDKSTLNCKIIDSSGRCYFLKRKPIYLSEEEFNETLRIQVYLLKNGIKVPYIYKDTEHDKLYVKYQENIFTLHEWILGSTHTGGWSQKDLTNIIVVMTKCARILSTYKPGDMHVPGNRINDLLDVSQESIYYLCDQIELFIKDPKLKNFVIQLKKDLLNLYLTINWEELNKTWIHGDYSLNNIIFVSKNQCVPIDFDDSHWNFRICDIISTAIINSMWSTHYYIVRPKLKGEYISELKKYIDIYNIYYPFNSEETKSIPYVVIMMFLRAMIVNNYLNDRENMPQFINVRVVEKQVEFLRFFYNDLLSI